ncbi:hypothetical protein ZHAS_00014259 [Anopheles sinensis]|uniref:Uncharacterized protein n=1 Tax=Anopheles sinensis TaxID=74873 RepID=A0A084W7T0_ANOSI|nr:hypothetical protein ZHAS_00014259 [Anopheles sinensis]
MMNPRYTENLGLPTRLVVFFDRISAKNQQQSDSGSPGEPTSTADYNAASENAGSVITVV